MKGIIIETAEGKVRLSFEGGFVVIKKDDIIDNKREVVKKKGRGVGKKTKYISYINSKGRKVYKLRNKKSVVVDRSEVAKIGWARRKERIENENKEIDKYEGLVKLNQNLNE